LVAQRLNVPYALLDDWIEGNPPIPDWKLTALIDLLDAANAGRA
jgi:hypothetical protein